MTKHLTVRWKTLLTISVWLGALSGCASTRVGFDIDPTTDFSKVNTYAWEPADISDPRLDNDPLFDSHVRSSVERQLTTKGYQKVSHDSADLLIRYHENTEHKVEILAVDSVYDYDPSYENRVIEFDEGTLVVDIAEAGSNKVVWRGWAQTNIDRALVDPQFMEKKIDEATRRMFERLPPVR